MYAPAIDRVPPVRRDPVTFGRETRLARRATPPIAGHRAPAGDYNCFGSGGERGGVLRRAAPVRLTPPPGRRWSLAHHGR